MTTTTTAKATKKTNEPVGTPVVISTGCPRSIGPEVAVAAAYRLRRSTSVVLVGQRDMLAAAARLKQLPSSFLDGAVDFDPSTSSETKKLPRVSIYDPGPILSFQKKHAGQPDESDGYAQLNYVEAAYALCKSRGLPMVTGPVSKEVIARCGLRRAKKFRGHTEWLEELDEAPYSVMCFQSELLTTSLVTTHVPVRALSRLLHPELVERATVELFDLVARLGKSRPHLAVCSLNPHAGEGELLGTEERTAIVPGVEAARARLIRRARISGPVGAETAFRKAKAGAYDGVVAIYHDQATIPMKLLAFGDAVNVTQGLSIVRTSVDHGTAYDIAGRGIADEQGMMQAIRLAGRLAQSRRRII